MAVGRSDWGGPKKVLGGEQLYQPLGGNKIFGPRGGVRGEFKGKIFLAEA